MKRFPRCYHLVMVLSVMVYATVFPGITSAGVNQWTSSGPGLTMVYTLAIDPVTSTTLYAGTNGEGIYRSIDGGATWSLVNTGLPIPYYMHTLAIDPATPSTLYAGGNGGVYKSTDSGGSWTAMNTGLPSVSSYLMIYTLAVDPVTSTTLYAGIHFWEGGLPRGGVYKSTDGGGSWTAMNAGLPSSANVNTLAIDPVTPNTLYTGLSYSPTRLESFAGAYKSTDGGGSWTAINTGLPAMTFTSVNTLAIDPVTPNTLYAGTGYAGTGYWGVYKSTDGGGSWTAINTGFPSHAYVFTLAIDPVTPTTLYAASGSNGVFKTTDGGASWIAINTGLPSDASVYTLAIDPATPTTLYAGTDGYGVFRYDYQGDTSAPSTPTGLVATAVSSSQIDLVWIASTDDVGVAGYRIFRNGTDVALSSTTSYSDTGLSAATTYTYTVAAYDAAGNVSAQSASASATTSSGGGNGGGGGGGGCFIETVGQGIVDWVSRAGLLGVLMAAFVLVIKVRRP